MNNCTFNSFIVFIFYILCCMKCYAANLRVVSDSSNVATFVKKHSLQKSNEYIIEIITNNETLKQKAIKINTTHNFTKAYCSDFFIALTNSDTNDKAAMCVLDLRNDDILVCEANFNTNNELVSTYTKNKLITTENGCYIEIMRVWHNDDWESSENNLYLRLGDKIPNKCTIQWIYSAKTKSFRILNYGQNASNNEYSIMQYPIKGIVLN